MARKLEVTESSAKRRAFLALKHSLGERERFEPDIRLQEPLPRRNVGSADQANVPAGLDAEAAHRAYRAAYERAVRYLAAREHSEQELLSKLRARETDPGLARQVVEALKQDNLQSDTRFAESLVRSRINRGQGPIRIRQELRRKGIGDDLQEEVLTHSGDFWVEIAAQARQKRFGDALPEDRGDWNRQARFLAGRGFPSDLIYRVLGNLG